MKATKLSLSLLAVMAFASLAAPAMAYEAGDWLVRGRVVNVDPHSDSGLLFVNGSAIPGSGVTVDDDTIPELDITYMIRRNWGVELILGYSKHDVIATGSVAALGRVIKAKALPPTLTLQYHFLPDSDYRPYLGAGVNYTYFWDETVTGVLDSGGTNAKVKMDDSWGIALQAGMDFAINENWFINADVKWIDMSTTAKFTDTIAGDARIDVDVDPFVYGVGVGYRF